jgi:hypothetical protein
MTETLPTAIGELTLSDTCERCGFSRRPSTDGERRDVTEYLIDEQLRCMRDDRDALLASGVPSGRIVYIDCNDPAKIRGEGCPFATFGEAEHCYRDSFQDDLGNCCACEKNSRVLCAVDGADVARIHALVNLRPEERKWLEELVAQHKQ